MVASTLRASALLKCRVAWIEWWRPTALSDEVIATRHKDRFRKLGAASFCLGMTGHWWWRKLVLYGVLSRCYAPLIRQAWIRGGGCTGWHVLTFENCKMPVATIVIERRHRMRALEEVILDAFKGTTHLQSNWKADRTMAYDESIISNGALNVKGKETGIIAKVINSLFSETIDVLSMSRNYFRFSLGMFSSIWCHAPKEIYGTLRKQGKITASSLSINSAKTLKQSFKYVLKTVLVAMDPLVCIKRWL